MSRSVQEPASHSPFKNWAFDNATFVIGAEAANVINVGIQLRYGGADIAERSAVRMYLSDDANGDSISAAPDSVAIGTDGVIIDPYAASQSFMAVSESDGDIDIDITEAGGADTFYLVVILPDGSLVVSSAITFAA